MKTLHEDAKLIDLAGGASILCKRMDMSNAAVCNWRWRGIPSTALLKHYAFFRKLKKVIAGNAILV